MADIDESKKRRRGPEPLSPAERRTHTVSVRLNAEELARLDAQRAEVAMERGEYLRAAGLHHLPPTIPAINREAWASLARVAGNLNQYQASINEGRTTGHPPEEIAALRELVQALRMDLIGARQFSGEDDEKS